MYRLWDEITQTKVQRTAWSRQGQYRDDSILWKRWHKWHGDAGTRRPILSRFGKYYINFKTASKGTEIDANSSQTFDKIKQKISTKQILQLICKYFVLCAMFATTHHTFPPARTPFPGRPSRSEPPPRWSPTDTIPRHYSVNGQIGYSLCDII